MIIIIENDEKITRNRIYQDLLNLGIEKEDKLFVHSSLKSIGDVDGGADVLIDALIDIVGEQGLIVMPTFTFSYVGRVEQGKSVPFNNLKSPADTGKISDTFWRREGVYRSKHPTHSVAAWGKDAKNFVQDHGSDTYEFEKGTPLHKLAMQGGKVLLIGLDQTSNSMIYIAETLAGLPYLEVPLHDEWGREYLLEDNNGKIYSVPIVEKMSGCSRQFIKLNSEFEKQKLIVHGRVGNADSMLMNAVEVIDVAVKMLRQDPEFLLCDSGSGCESCNRRREFIKNTK
ncbi:MAG: AAC(3) family N-acetyltransferase [Clostridia bacterium]|nr:AAC(3) family N-acetyltransferase [Clostridia bacterium]